MNTIKSYSYKSILRVPPVKSHSMVGCFFSILLALASFVGCASSPAAQDRSFVEEPILAGKGEDHGALTLAINAVNAEEWDKAKEQLSSYLMDSDNSNEPTILAAKILLARTSLGSLRWILDGSPPSVSVTDPAVSEAFQELKKIVETPNIDPRIHYTARLYLAVIYLLDHQKDQVNALLKDYPSYTLSSLVLDGDRIPLRFLLASALSAAGRHLESAYAYEKTLQEVENNFRQEGSEGKELRRERSLFEELLLTSMADEVARFTADERSESVATGEPGRVRSLSIFELLKIRGGEKELSDQDKEDILQSLSEIENDLISAGHRDELLSFKDRLNTRGGVVAIRNVGVLLPFSGVHRAYAVSAQEAIMVTSSGFESGSGNAPIRTRFIFLDSNANPRENVALLKKNNVLAVIGPLTAERTEVYAPLLEKEKIPMLSLSTSLPLKNGNYAFQFYLNAIQEAESMAKVSAKNLNDLRAVILYIPNGYGRAMSAAFAKTYQGYGGEVLFQETIDDNVNNFSDLAERVAATNPQTIFIAARPEKIAELSAFFAQQNIWGISPSRQARLDNKGRHFVHYLGTSLWQDNPLLRQSYSYLEGALIPAWSSPLYKLADRGATLEAKFLSATGRVPDTFKVVVADAAMLANDFLTQRGVDSGERFREELLNGKPFAGNAGNVQFTDNGEVRRELRLLQIKSGQVVLSPIKL